jgi:kynurenine formamidase
MSVYPGDPQPELRAVCDFADCGVRSTVFTVSAHCGAHADAFSHMLPGGRDISDIPLDSFFGSAAVLDCRGLKTIPPERFEKNEYVKKADIILFFTGWDSFFGKNSYLSGYPSLSETSARLLVGMGKKAVGFDSISADAAGSADYPIHKILLSGGVVIYENLRALDKIPVPEFSFFGLPLKLPGAEASPVRAIAVW